MQPRDRLSFSPITKRPALRFPSGIRLVVWPVLALEEWDISRPMARTVPHRIGHVQRTFEEILSRDGVVAWDGSRILDWYLAQQRQHG